MEAAAKEKSRCKEDYTKLKAQRKDVNESAPLPPPDSPPSMEIVAISPSSIEPQFKVGDIVRNKVIRGSRSIHCRIESWSVSSVSIDDRGSRYNVVNILDQKVRKLFSEHELERGEESGFKVSLAECNTSKKRKAVQEEISKRVKVFNNWRKARKDFRELLAVQKSLKGKLSKVRKVNSDLLEANTILSTECEEVNVATLFTPSTNATFRTPKAKQIVHEHNSILHSTQFKLQQKVLELQKELRTSKRKITEGNTQVRRLRLKLRESRLESRRKVEALNAEMSKLRQENKINMSNLRKENSTLLKIADDLNADARKDEDDDDADKELKVLNIMLAGVSVRQASAIDKKYTSTYAHMMRQ